MDRISYLKARLREFSELATAQETDTAREYYRGLEIEFEERLARITGRITANSDFSLLAR